VTERIKAHFFRNVISVMTSTSNWLIIVWIFCKVEETILKAAQLFECDPIYMADNEDLSVDDFQMINSLCRLLENYV